MGRRQSGFVARSEVRTDNLPQVEKTQVLSARSLEVGLLTAAALEYSRLVTQDKMKGGAIGRARVMMRNCTPGSKVRPASWH